MKKTTKLQLSFILAFLLFATSIFAQTTVVTPITQADADNGDDAEERVSNGGMDLGSSDLEFYSDPDDPSTEQYVGIRFQNVNVPQGATITNAYIQFRTDEVSTGSVTIDIVGIDVNNAAQFTSTAYNISRRIDGTISDETTANSTWTPADWNTLDEQGVNQQTSNLSSIVQEIVNRGGWNANNSMAFVFKPNSGSPNRRTADDGDSAGQGAILNITYATGPAEIDVIGNSVSILDGDTTPDVSDDTQFGIVSVGQTKNTTFTIVNEGAATLNLNNGSITGDSEFTVSTLPPVPSLDAGESTTFVISFTPIANGVTSNATISISTNDADENPYTFDIQGTGVTPNVEIDIQDSYTTSITDGSGNSPSLGNSTDFGGTDSSNPISTIFRIENTGTTDLNLGSLTSSNSDFAITSSPSSSVSGGSVTTFEITFTPSTTGLISSTITLVNDDTDENPYTFTVQGTGYTDQSYIVSGDTWNYYDNSNQPSNDAQGDTWVEIDFDDSSWSSDSSPLGYGDMNGTALSNINNSTEVAYFRKSFNVTDHTIFNALNLEAIRDDGMVVYINGTEVWRENMDGNMGDPVSYSDFANTVVGGADESAWFSKTVSSLLVTGTNVVAVEVHQENAGSSDISFDFSLNASGAPYSNSIVRGPYLQSGTPTSVFVRWRTDSATDTKVNYGTTLGSLSSSVSDATLTTEHEIQITGLTPNTKYYYELEDVGGVYHTQSINVYYTTAPTVTTDQYVRAWILGDAGTANQDQRNVRDAYYNYVASTPTNPNQTDMMLFLGDNAYNSGTDNEYQSAFYEIYDDMLKKSVAWSTLGNHDGYSAVSSSQTGPYYDMFTFPTAAEAGGVASGTEAYYSFDYANIHFIVLESYHLEGDATQHTWLENDIAATSQDWIVALYHHPSYTKGSHDSDTESDLITVRSEFLHRLEDGGVDLVLTGHSHSYERSYFINGHYGLSGTFSGGSGGSHIVGANGHLSGKDDTADGAYIKSNPAEGSVYITTGSAGKATGADFAGEDPYNAPSGHDAMYYSDQQLGSTILEIEDDGLGGQNLNIKFLTDGGVIDDYFTINKAGVSAVLANEANKIEIDGLTIYPVPSNSFLNIELESLEQLQTIKFFNTVGALVKESTKEQINVRSLDAGVYMLEIKTDQKTYYKSVIIE